MRFKFPETQPNYAERHLRAGRDLARKTYLPEIAKEDVFMLVAPLEWERPSPIQLWWAAIDSDHAVGAVLLTINEFDDYPTMDAYEAERFVRLLRV